MTYARPMLRPVDSISQVATSRKSQIGLHVGKHFTHLINRRVVLERVGAMANNSDVPRHVAEVWDDTIERDALRLRAIAAPTERNTKHRTHFWDFEVFQAYAVRNAGLSRPTPRAPEGPLEMVSEVGGHVAPVRGDAPFLELLGRDRSPRRTRLDAEPPITRRRPCTRLLAVARVFR